jgi:hypothetical protein
LKGKWGAPLFDPDAIGSVDEGRHKREKNKFNGFFFPFQFEKSRSQSVLNKEK